MGVKPFYKHFKHDGVTGPNMATVYSDQGFGVRAPVVFYNRSQRGRGATEARRLRLGGDLCRWRAWVHCGGIFAALSPTTAPLAAEMMKAAKAAGAITSFDLNFREKLWKIHGGNERAVETIATIVENVDVLVGNEEDLQKGLGIPGPEVAAKSKLDPQRVLRHD
jgi:2-dehydro-3-deoxygluconokinase